MLCSDIFCVRVGIETVTLTGVRFVYTMAREGDATKNDNKFYTNAKVYWNDIPATIDGMLGGYGHISQVDIQGSKQFLKHILSLNESPGRQRALDCGAGIGRITKGLLAGHFDKVDLLEQNPAFLEKAKVYLEAQIDKIGDFLPVGLQAFEPPDAKYDVIWAQWVLGHLTDEHFIKFLHTCKQTLKHKGVIVIKENVTSSGDVEVDEKDSSVTRTYELYIELFEKAGMQCFKKTRQLRLPKELYKVYMFALRPKISADEEFVESAE